MADEKKTIKDAKKKLETLFDELLGHDGFADLRVEMRLLKRGQKEVIIYCGKQYRYVLDFQPLEHGYFQNELTGHRESAEL